jgi:hypothetical protein
MPRFFLLLVVVLISAWSVSAPACLAQAPPAELREVMSSDSISAAQSDQISQWVDACVKAVQAGRTDALQRVRADFFALTGESATPAFRSKLAELFAQRIAELMGRFNAEQSRVVVMALAATQAPPAIEPLLGALSAADPATRALAARGLGAFGGNLGSSAEQAIERLGKVALAEPVPLVKASLCRALGTAARAGTVAPILAEIIGEHSDRLRRDGPADVTPLLAAIEALNGLQLDGVSAQDRPPVVGAVANLLQYSVTVYTGNAKLEKAIKENLERIIYRAEVVLGRLLAAEGAAELPGVAEAMMSGGKDVPDKMRAELDKWLGTAGSPGVLNAAPWSLPVGGGFAPVE